MQRSVTTLTDHVRHAHRSSVRLPAVGGVRRAGQCRRGLVPRGRGRPARRSGPSRPTGCPGTRRSPRCWTGRMPRSPSGSSAASSTSPTTASTATSRPATATGWRSTGRASRSATAATLTYAELQAEVCKAANALTELGLVAGDRVAIYMPMVPEAIVAMLACARLGVHALAWCSPGSRRRRWTLASRTPRPSSSSPPTGSTGAARRCR